MAEKKPRLKIEEDRNDGASADASHTGAHFSTAVPADKGTGAEPASSEARKEAVGAEGPAPVQDKEGARGEKGGRSFGDVTKAVGSWLTRTFPGHENAVLFGFLGFIIAILIFIIGFWRTLFIAFVVVVGVAIGQYLDGDPKIYKAIRRALGENRD